MLELCGLKGHRIGGAHDLAQARELHRERGRRDERGLRRADGRGAPARARASSAWSSSARSSSRACPSFRCHHVGSTCRAANPGRMVGGRSERGSRRHAAAASVVVPFPRGAAGDRLDLVRFVPSGRSLLATFGVLVAVGVAYWVAYATPVFAVERVEVRGAPPAARARGDARDARRRRTEPRRGRRRRGRRHPARLPAVAGVSVDRAFPHTLVVKVAPERPVAVVRRGDVRLARHRVPARSIREIETGTRARAARGSGSPKGATIRVGGQLPGGLRARPRARSLRRTRPVSAVA